MPGSDVGWTAAERWGRRTRLGAVGRMLPCYGAIYYNGYRGDP